MDPFFGPLRDQGSFETIAEWLEDPTNNIPMFHRRYGDFDPDKPFIRWVEFSKLEFGPTDGLFPPAWSGTILMYCRTSTPETLKTVFAGSGIEFGEPEGYWRGEQWIWRCRFVMLPEDFPALFITQRLSEPY
jgi:hypothetical protein